MVNYQRIAVLLWCAGYYFLLNCSYASIESALFSDIGLQYAPPPPLYRLAGFAFAMVPAGWLPVALRRPSTVCLWIFYIVLVAPLMFVPFHVCHRPPQEVLILSLSILGLFAFLGWMQFRPLINLPVTYLDRQKTSTALLFLTLALISVVILTLDQFDLSLEGVYDRRFAARELVQPRTVLAYAISLLSGSLGPILVSMGYVHKRWGMLSVGILGLLSVFALSGTKTDLLAPLFLLLLFLLISGNRRWFAQKIMCAACLLILLSIAEFALRDSYTLSTYFVRRQIFGPSLLTATYWDFFRDNPHVYYSDSFLRWLVPPQYDLPIAQLIGEVRFHSFENNANANFWATAFAHVGYIGMVVTTFALGMLLRLIDSIAHHGEMLVACLVVGICSITWSNGALETSLLSNGVGFSILILCVLRVPPQKSGVECVERGVDLDGRHLAIT
jgi:hypothetical protein